MGDIPKGRLLSLDAFRGITIAGMILVNKPGSWTHVHPPLLHADWHGWTPTDLIFPFFLFIIGVAMTFSFSRRMEEGGRGALYRKIIWRSFIIYALGLLLNAFPAFDLENLRFTGVLPRIAIVYLISSIIVLNATLRGQIAFCWSLLVVYWGLMTLAPVPGHGAGVLTPEGNLAAYVDSLFLPGRMWQGTWDPEGILSTIPAVSTTLFGVLTGHWLRTDRDRKEIAAWLFVAGWGAILAGMLWGIWFPINKQIWTSSYALFTAGAALQFLGVCYWLIDVYDFRRWFYPALVFGMNAIAVYVLSSMMISLFHYIHLPGEGSSTVMAWIYQNLFAAWLAPKNASLGFALVYVVFWFSVMDLFYRKRVFIRV